MGTVDQLAAQNQLDRIPQADQARQANRATPAWDQADLDLGKTDLRSPICAQYPPITPTGKLGPAPNTRPINCGDRDAGQLRQLAKELLTTPRHPFSFGQRQVKLGRELT